MKHKTCIEIQFFYKEQMESVLSFYTMWIQETKLVIKLDTKHAYPLNHLTNPDTSKILNTA